MDSGLDAELASGRATSRGPVGVDPE